MDREDRERPADIDRFKRLKAKAKKLLERAAKLEPSVRSYLENGDYDDCKLIPTRKIDVNSEKAMLWSERNLDRKELDSLFVEVFNKDAFVKLIKRKNLKPEMRKIGILTVKKGAYIRLTY